MWWRMHEGGMDQIGPIVEADILATAAEMNSRRLKALLNVGLIRKLMRQRVSPSHGQRVLPRGLNQFRIALQRSQSSLLSRFV